MEIATRPVAAPVFATPAREPSVLPDRDRDGGDETGATTPVARSSTPTAPGIGRVVDRTV